MHIMPFTILPQYCKYVLKYCAKRRLAAGQRFAKLSIHFLFHHHDLVCEILVLRPCKHFFLLKLHANERYQSAPLRAEYAAYLAMEPLGNMRLIELARLQLREGRYYRHNDESSFNQCSVSKALHHKDLHKSQRIFRISTVQVYNSAVCRLHVYIRTRFFQGHAGCVYS
jgi:hypothetical protein